MRVRVRSRSDDQMDSELFEVRRSYGFGFGRGNIIRMVLWPNSVAIEFPASFGCLLLTTFKRISL